MKYSEVIGQSDCKTRLQQMVSEGRIPHAMMFCGPTGYGTYALALAFASYLLGEREEGTNPNVQAMLNKMQHPDLHFVFPCIRPTGTSSSREITSDDFVREWTEMLRKSAYFTFEQWLESMDAANQQAIIFAAEGDSLTRKLTLKSSQGGYKVCIIWLPERMHQTFANKILKILEEPPQMTMFLLVSEQPEKLLDTIRSRVQRIDVKRIADKDIEDALVNKRGLDPQMAHRVARIAAGNWNRALQELDSGNESHQFLDMFIMLMRMAYTRDTRGLKKWSETVAAFGREKQRRMLVYFSNQVRENFMHNFQEPDLNYMSEEEEAFSTKFSRFINEANVVEIQELIERTIRAIGQNANPKMQFFDMALNMIVLIMRK